MSWHELCSFLGRGHQKKGKTFNVENVHTEYFIILRSEIVISNKKNTDDSLVIKMNILRVKSRSSGF